MIKCSDLLPSRTCGLKMLLHSVFITVVYALATELNNAIYEQLLSGVPTE